MDFNLSRAEQNIDQTCLPETAPFGCFPVVDADHNYVTTKLTAKNTSFFQTGLAFHELRTGIELSQRDRLDADAAPGGSDKRFALFAVDNIEFGDNLTLTPALRYETQNIKGNTAPNDGKYNNDAIMGGLSARYEFNSGFAIFGSAAYTEMMPIIDDLSTPLYLTQPEKSRTYEAGISYSNNEVFSSGDVLQLKANFYNTHVWDVTSYTGVSAIDVKGVEIEASYSHASGLYADFNATSADGSKYASNSQLIGPWEYAPETAGRLTLGKHIGEELDVSWELIVAKSAISPTSGEKLGGYGVNNLRVTYRPQDGVFEGTEIRVGIENILNKSYQTQLSTRVAPGRNFKLTLSKSF